MCQSIEWNQHVYSFKDRKPQLPVERRGQILTAHWKGYCSIDALKAGHFQGQRAELVEIPALRGFSGGIWFQIRMGIRGVLIHGTNKELWVYMLIAPSTHYFKTMTGSARMPVLIKQVI